MNVHDAKRLITSVSEKIILMQKEYTANKSGEEIEKVKQYINEKIFSGKAEELTLIDVAEHFNKNPNYLSTIFTEYVGINFKDYIIDIRLEKAEADLHNTNKTVSEIANNLGYYNVSYFIKIFKRKYGCTPKQYCDRISLNQ